MLKIKTTHILYVLCVFVGISCTRDNFLDIQPLGEFIPSSVEDYRLLLDNVDGESSNGEISFGFDEKHNLPYAVNDNHVLFPEQF